MKRKIIAKVLVLGLLVWGMYVGATAIFHETDALLRLQALQLGDLITLVVTATMTAMLLANITFIASKLKKELVQNRRIDD